jgi:hypothetical protein
MDRLTDVSRKIFEIRSQGLALTPTLSRRERGFAPFSLREKGRG